MKKTAEFHPTLTGKIKVFLMPENIYLGKVDNVVEGLDLIEKVTGQRPDLRDATPL